MALEVNALSRHPVWKRHSIYLVLESLFTAGELFAVWYRTDIDEGQTLLSDRVASAAISSQDLSWKRQQVYWGCALFQDERSRYQLIDTRERDDCSTFHFGELVNQYDSGSSLNLLVLEAFYQLYIRKVFQVQT